MAYSLTPNLARLKNFIAEQIGSTGIAPTYDEMASHLGLKSKSGIHRFIHDLEARGHVRLMRTDKGFGKSRAIEVIQCTRSTLT